MDRGWWRAWSCTSIATPRRCGRRASIRIRPWCSRSRRRSSRLRAGELDDRIDRATLRGAPGTDAVPSSSCRCREPRSCATRCSATRCAPRRFASTDRMSMPRRLVDVLSAIRELPRTRWVDELVQRYVFEREVCQHRREQGGAVPRGRADEGDLLPRLRASSIAGRAARSCSRATRSPRKARAWIEEHLFEPFTIDALVQHCHASESTVLRAFRKELGVAPLGVPAPPAARGERCSCSSPGATRVTEVATRVGYENPSAFAAAFRAQFGVAPSRVKPTRAGRRAPAGAWRATGPTARNAEVDGAPTARAAAACRAWCRLCGPHVALRRRLIARLLAADRQRRTTPPTRPSTSSTTAPDAGRAQRAGVRRCSTS